ncbi:MAG: hypothetical protein ACT4OW_05080 [Nitrososphaerota archaeon]
MNVVFFTQLSYATNSGPTSTLYNITSVKIGSSGIQNSTSSSYKVTATVGDLVGTIFSSSYQLFAGFLSTTQAQPSPGQIFNVAGATTTTNNNGYITGVTIPQGTTSAPYDISSSFNSATGKFSFPADLTATMTFAGGATVTMILPSSVQFTAGSDFTGSFQMPTEKSIASITATIPGTGSKATSVGFAASGITMSEPVKITVSGEAGKSAAFVDSSNTVTTISLTCSSATSVTNTQLPDTSGANSACTIDSGSDLIVWTRHFTDVVTFTPSSSSSSSSSGGGFAGKDVIPPSITQGYSENEFPLVIGNTKFSNLGDPTMKRETAIVKTGTQIPITMLLSEDNGPQNIQHVAIYFDLGPNHDVQFSQAWLSYEKGSGVTKHDPNGIFKDAYASTSTKNNKLEIIFYATFAKPIETSDVAIRAWDFARTGLSIVIPNGLKVIDEKENEIKEKISSDMNQEKSPEPQIKPAITPEPGIDVVPEPGMEVVTTDQKETIQKWAGYHVMSASDSELLDILQIKLDDNDQSELPKWVKKNLGKWILDEKISFKEFREAIQYVAKL